MWLDTIDVVRDKLTILPKRSRNQKKSANAYKYSAPLNQGEILNCAYIGQLKVLMFEGNIWPTFRRKFTDKRQLEEMVADIVPVRNE